MSLQIAVKKGPKDVPALCMAVVSRGEWVHKCGCCGCGNIPMRYGYKCKVCGAKVCMIRFEDRSWEFVE